MKNYLIKLAALSLSAIMCVSLLIACGNADTTPDEQNQTTEETVEKSE